MKRINIIICLTLILIALTAVPFTVAYFTSEEKDTKSYTVGAGVEIELTQPSWAPDSAKSIYPGYEINQDPTVKVLKDDAWVRIKLNLTDIDGIPLGEVTAAEIWDMIDFNLADFELDQRFSIGTIRYYNYKSVLKKPDGGKTLFTKVKIPSSMDVASVAEMGSFKILVTAEAIQVKGFESNPLEAFSTLHSDLAQ